MKFLSYVSKHFWQILTVLLIIGFAGVVYLYTYPFKPAVINKVSVLNEVSAGGEITYQLDFCRYVRKGTEIHPRRFLVPKDKPVSDSVELSSNPSLETEGDPGCYPTPRPITIPVDSSTKPGEYQLMIQVRYCIFLGRCILVEKRSDYFTITKPSIPDQLSNINKQLQEIGGYLGNPHGDALSNIVQADPIPEPLLPQAGPSIKIEQPTPQQESPNQAPTASPDSRGLIQSTLDDTFNTVRDITKMIGL